MSFRAALEIVENGSGEIKCTCRGHNECSAFKNEPKSCYHGKRMCPGVLEFGTILECDRAIFSYAGKTTKGDNDFHYFSMVDSK